MADNLYTSSPELQIEAARILQGALSINPTTGNISQDARNRLSQILGGKQGINILPDDEFQNEKNLLRGSRNFNRLSLAERERSIRRILEHVTETRSQLISVVPFINTIAPNTNMTVAPGATDHLRDIIRDSASANAKALAFYYNLVTNNGANVAEVERLSNIFARPADQTAKERILRISRLRKAYADLAKDENYNIGIESITTPPTPNPTDRSKIATQERKLLGFNASLASPPASIAANPDALNKYIETQNAQITKTEDSISQLITRREKLDSNLQRLHNEALALGVPGIAVIPPNMAATFASNSIANLWNTPPDEIPVNIVRGTHADLIRDPRTTRAATLGFWLTNDDLQSTIDQMMKRSPTTPPPAADVLRQMIGITVGEQLDEDKRTQGTDEIYRFLTAKTAAVAAASPANPNAPIIPADPAVATVNPAPVPIVNPQNSSIPSANKASFSQWASSAASLVFHPFKVLGSHLWNGRGPIA